MLHRLFSPAPDPRWPRRWGPVAVLGGSLLGVSCGQSDSTIDLFAAGGAAGDPQCSAAGETCPFGCADGLGCVDCQNDASCPTDQPFCVLGECSDCRGTTDCPAGQACRPSEHECEDLCVDGADCDGDEPFCDSASQACIGCRNDGDCAGERPVCDPVQKQCSECVSDAGCPPEQPVCDVEDGHCRECLVDAHCGAGELCGSDHDCYLP